MHNVIVACVGEDVVATEDAFVESDESSALNRMLAWTGALWQCSGVTTHDSSSGRFLAFMYLTQI